MLDPEVFRELDLDPETYSGVFRDLASYWAERLPDHGDYVLCSALQLRRILRTPEDWKEIGIYLADATLETYRNGSHSFIEHTVPALIGGGIARTKKKLKSAVSLLLTNVNPYYAGEHAFDEIAERIESGEFRSLQDIKMLIRPNSTVICDDHL